MLLIEVDYIISTITKITNAIAPLKSESSLFLTHRKVSTNITIKHSIIDNFRYSEFTAEQSTETNRTKKLTK